MKANKIREKYETMQCPCGCVIRWRGDHVYQYVPLSCPFDNQKIGRELIRGFHYRPMEAWRSS